MVACRCMSWIDYYGITFQYPLFYSNFNAFANEQIKKIFILQTLFSELGQKTGMDYFLFRGQSQKVFERHIITRPLNNALIRKIIKVFQKQIFEEKYRAFCTTSIIKAIFTFKLFVHKRKVNYLVDFSQYMILWDDTIIQVWIIRKVQFQLGWQHNNLQLFWYLNYISTMILQPLFQWRPISGG